MVSPDVINEAIQIYNKKYPFDRKPLKKNQLVDNLLSKGMPDRDFKKEKKASR